MTGQDIKKIERSFKSTVDTVLQKNLVLWAKELLKIRFDKFIYEESLSNEDRNLTIGELRVYKKLIDMLEPTGEIDYLFNE